MRVAGRERHLHALVDHMIVIDDSGGESITSFSDEDAVLLFLEWLHDAREREAARCAQYELERVSAEREAEITVRRAGMREAIIQGGKA